MATYIPGTKSYMPEFKPFTPDYKFISNVLQTKENRYNTNYKQLNDIYSKIVYAPLSREDTQFMRDQYTEGLSNKLEKISGMDLSLQQNVDTAKAVFSPFFQEDIIVRDMVMTKTFQNEQAYANRLLNDPDRDRREMYWQTGMDAMNYRMQDFINADPDAALGMALPKYVPDADLYELSLDILKESGLSVKKDVLSETGQWVITQENGELVTGQALEMIQRQLTDDPRVQQAYFTQSFVEGRKYADNTMNEGRASSIDQGQREWALGIISEYQVKAAERSIKQKQNLAQQKNTITSWDLFMKKYGIVPGSQQEVEMKRQYGEYTAMQQSLNNSNNIISETSMPTNGQSTQDLLNRAYNITMQYNIKDDMIAAARAYGKMSASTTIKMENPEYARQRKFQYDKALESIKQANKKEIAQMKIDAKKPAAGLLSSGRLTEKFGEPGTTAVKETIDEEGEVVKDVIALGNSQILEQEGAIDGSKVLQILSALPSFQPDADGNNLYTLTLEDEEGNPVEVQAPIGGPLSTGGNTLYEMLMQQTLNESGQPTGQYKYSKDINKLYDKYNSYLNPAKDVNGFDITAEEGVKNILTDFPDLTMDTETYLQLKGGFSNVNKAKGKLANIVSERGKYLHDQYELVKGGKMHKDYDQEVVKFIEEGLDIDIFNPNGESWDIKSKDEFINEYVQGAREGKYKDANISGNWFWGDDHNASYIGKEKIKRPEGLYDIMYTMLNNTQNGTYTGEAEQVRAAGTDKSISGIIPTKNKNTFQTYDVGRALRGEQPKGTLVDLISSPSYSYDINPFTINQDATAASLVLDMMDQFDKTTMQQMSIQAGDLAKIEDADLSAATDDIAGRLLQAYLRQIKAFSISPDEMSKSNVPYASITYNPTYSAPGEVSGDKASYVIDFDPNWVKSQLGLYTAGSESGQAMKPSIAASYNTITFAFDDDVDISVRKEGAYNYSNTMSEIEQTKNGQYLNDIANGGTVRVNQNLQGEYIGHVKLLQYDPETGNFNVLPEKTYNLNTFVQQQTGTNDMKSYLDGATRYMEVIVEDKMLQNKNLLEETNAAKNAVK